MISMLAELGSTDWLTSVDRLRHRSQNWCSHHRKVTQVTIAVVYGGVSACTTSYQLVILDDPESRARDTRPFIVCIL